MVNETALRETVGTTFDHLRNQKDDILTLMAEISALRDALDELSEGRFAPIFEKHWGRMVAQTDAAKTDLAQKFEQTVHRVRAGEVF
jgi:hypothetical protein